MFQKFSKTFLNLCNLALVITSLYMKGNRLDLLLNTFWQSKQRDGEFLASFKAH